MSKETSKLASVFKQLKKDFDVEPVDLNKIQDIPRWKISYPSLSYLLGGGLPKGRIIEIYGQESGGKSLMSTLMASDVQKQGGTVVYIDMECSFSVKFAEQLGLNCSDNFILLQPKTGEDVFNIIRKVAETGEVALIIVDSVSAMVPKAELEGDVGDAFMGLQARMMGQGLRMITGVLNQTGTTTIFINQVRQKIGVMYGCVHGDTLVNTEIGPLPIREIVESKEKLRVWSYNELDKKFELKTILDWHYNGNVESPENFLHFLTESTSGGGKFGFSVTPDHLVYTDNGWKKANDVLITDKLLSYYSERLNKSLLSFIAGTVVGDSNLYVRSKNTASLRLMNNKNPEYVQWKVSKINSFYRIKRYGIGCRQWYDSEFTHEFALLKKEIGERDPSFFFKNYSDMGLAIWLMDDGNYDSQNYHSRYSLSIKRFKKNQEVLDKVKEGFAQIGLPCAINLSTGTVMFSAAVSVEIAKRIAPYIPDCMQYKLPEVFKGQYKDFSLESDLLTSPTFVKIIDISPISKRQFRTKGKYDLTIEDNCNYTVGGSRSGVLVHNSPNTTSGGNSLKFYASIRMDVSRKENIGPAEKVTGIVSKIKTPKNKTAPPFRVQEVTIDFKKGVDLYMEYVNFGIMYTFITRAGAWYTYEGLKAQGREGLVEELKKNDDLFAKLKISVDNQLLCDTSSDEAIIDEEDETVVGDE